MVIDDFMRFVIQDGPIERLDKYIQKRRRVNGYFKDGTTPLLFAIECEQKYRRNILVRVDGEWICRQDAVIIRLIDAGADVNVESYGDHHIPLISALSNRLPYKVIHKLIDAGANINAKSSPDCKTPLIAAIEFNYDNRLIDYLIRRGAQVNDSDHKGCTPLSYAVVRSAKFEIAKTLIDAGASINIVYGNGFNLLGQLSCNGKCKKNYCKYNKELIQLLIDEGIDIKQIDTTGQSLISISDCSYLINRCVQSGISVNMGDKMKFTPLFEALYSSNIKKMKNLLFKFGADPNCEFEDSHSLLHWATEMCDHDACDLLFYFGADMFAKNLHNDTAFDIIKGGSPSGLPNSLEDLIGTGIIRNYLLFKDEQKFIDPFFQNDRCEKCKKLIKRITKDCDRELIKMKNKFIIHGLTFYDFCVKKIFHNSNFIDVSVDEFRYNHAQIKRLFPIYHNLINLRMRDNQHQRQKRSLRLNLSRIIIKSAVVNESGFDGIKIPYDCLELIGRYLDYDDLYNLFLASVDDAVTSDDDDPSR